jgi:hypothetical protein
LSSLEVKSGVFIYLIKDKDLSNVDFNFNAAGAIMLLASYDRPCGVKIESFAPRHI